MERRIISVELRASQSGKQLSIGGYAARVQRPIKHADGA